MKTGEKMKFSILSRGDETSNQIKSQVEQYLVEFGLTYHQEEPDIVISVGGDGTMLQAFHQYVHRLEYTAFLGLHTGHLGFYADWRPHEIEKLVMSIAKMPLETVEYPLLEIIIDHKNQEQEHFLALNECTVKTTVGSLVMNIQVNQDHFETFRGDGLCISTPSGSTAYNKSLGGALLHPALSAIQLTEMASINNRLFRTIGSPLIFPKHHQCILKPLNDVDYVITVDHVSLIEKDVDKMTLQVAKEKVRFARYRSFPFWKRVRESFIDAD
jgi:NAD+ kinase